MIYTKPKRDKTTKEILEFIERFKMYEKNNVLVDTFTEGFCYEFAYMIWRNHKGVRIFFLLDGDHYIAEYKGTYFDINGEYTIQPNTRLREDEIGISTASGRLKKNMYEL